MKLRDYLYYNNIQIAEMAEKLMVAPSYLSDISRGMRKPSIRLAKQIQQLTKSKVTIEEILCQEPIKIKKRPRSASHKSKPKSFPYSTKKEL